MKAEIIVKLKIDKHEVSLTLSEVKELYNQLKELVDKQIQYYPVYPEYPYRPWTPWTYTWNSTSAHTDSMRPVDIAASAGTGEISSASLWAVAE